MANPLFIFVGAKPPKVLNGNPGGQLTSSIGLHDYAALQGYRLEVLDTLQESFPIPSFRRRAMRGFSRICGMLKYLNTQKITGVIIFSTSGISFYERTFMAALCRLYHVKTIFFMRSGFFVNEVESNWMIKGIAKRLLKFPDLIGVQGDSWRPFYSKLGVSSEKIVTVRNWLVDDLSPVVNPIARIGNDRVSFCFVGWLVENKGVRELLKAIQLLAKKYDFNFYFVGGGDLSSVLAEEIRQTNLGHRVKLTGWVDSIGVRSYLERSHVFVLPSKAEGFPNALLEAMALGLPAICTNVGAISDSVKNESNGYLLEDGNADSIAKAMQCYLLNPELIYQHSVETLKIVDQKHDRNKNCKLLFDCFL